MKKRCTLLILFFFSIISLTVAQCPLTATAVTTPADCGADGQIEINITGGDGAIFYQLTDGPTTTGIQGSNTFTSLVPGTYEVTVTSACDDFIVDDIVITSDYEQMTASATTTSPTCDDGDDGSFTVTAQNGKPDYSYQIISPITSAANTTGIFTGLEAGTYQVRVFDDCGNFITQTVNLQDPDLAPLNLSTTRVITGCTTGDITATGNGGLSGYTYQLLDSGNNVLDTNSTGSFPNLAVDLVNGTLYKVRVTDACGSVRIRNARFNAVQPTFNLQPRCSGAGNLFYRFRPNIPINPRPTPIAWTLTDESNNTVDSGTQNANNGPWMVVNTPGTYTITGVTTGCGTFSRTVDIGTDAPFDFTVDDRAPDVCDTTNGEVRINYSTSTGGTPRNADVLYELISGPSSFGPYPKTVGRTINAPEGNYVVRVSLQNGNNTCVSAEKPFSIESNDLYSFSLDATAESGCPGSNTITATADIENGGNNPQVNYELYNSSNQLVDSNTTGNFVNVTPGDYQVRAAQNNGNCTQEVVDVTVTGYEFPTLDGSRATLCDDGTATLSVLAGKGVEPYQYQIKPAGAPESDYSALQSNAVFSGLGVGSYDVRVVDDCGNTALTTLTATAITPPSVSITGERCIGESFSFSAPRVPGATYLWTSPNRGTFNTRTIVLDNLTAADEGQYDLLFSIQGCSSVIQSVTLDVLELPQQPTIDNFVGCSTQGSFNLNASIGTGETGQWEVITEPNVGDATISDTTDPNSAIAFAAEGNYSFRWTVTNADGCTNFAEQNILVNCAVLPVKLISFDAQKTGQDVSLTWSTASEVNNDYFEVQYSLDGINFFTLASIDGNGDSTEQIDYQATHLNVNQYGVSVVYYRLNQVDFDGSAEYSDIVSVSLNENAFVLYPNPVSLGQELTINYNGIRQIEIYNAMGILVNQFDFNEPTMSHSFSTDELSAGLYFIVINRSQKKKFVKQ